MSILNPKCHRCNKDIDECRCKTLERRRPNYLSVLKKENDDLKDMLVDILWMARRYSHGRDSYSVSMCQTVINKAIKMGIDVGTDFDGEVFPKSRTFNPEWFRDNED